MTDIVERLRDTTEQMACTASVDMALWGRHSNACLEAADEIEKLRAALIDTLASLVASVDLLERGGKKAAPSNKMFEQMLVDYKNSIERGRAAAAALKETGNE